MSKNKINNRDGGESYNKIRIIKHALKVKIEIQKNL